MNNKLKVESIKDELKSIWMKERISIIQFNNLFYNVQNWIHKTIHDENYYEIEFICNELGWINGNRTKDNDIRKPLIKKLINEIEFRSRYNKEIQESNLILDESKF